MLIRTLAAAASVLALTACSTPAAAIGSMVDVNVIDRITGETLPMYWHDGRWWVPGKPGNRYAVTLTNRSGGRTLTVISVDGVNAISGETAAHDQTGYVLNPGQHAQITGWRKNLARVAAFEFTALPNSYAARTGRPDNVGVIGVALFRKKAEPEAFIQRDRLSDSRQEAPGAAGGAGAAAESSTPRAAAADSMSRPAPAPQAAEKSTSLGTGHGRNEASRVIYTSFERATLHPGEVIAIHYDSYSNLVAMGVIRTPQIARPTPFPGQFVPDPR